MTERNLSAYLAEASAFGAYVRELRSAIQLRQEDLCLQLRDLGFRTSTKDVYQWENGMRRPSSATRAGLIRVLGGSSSQADELLLYDIHAEAQMSIAFAEGDLARLTEHIQLGTAQGVTFAKEWVKRQALEKKSLATGRLATDVARDLQILGATLFASDSHAFEEWLRFGVFRLAELDK